jgi:hypothetical protein
VKENKECLVIPSCNGLLDCFNTKKNKYRQESLCHLVTDEDINSIFIITLFSFIYHYCNRKDTDTYTIKLSQLKHFRQQTHGSKPFDVKAELDELNNIGCYWYGLEIVRLAEIIIDGRKATIKSKYFAELFKAMKYLTQRKDSTHSSSYTSLISTEILKERNRSAVEIVIEICKLVERRGAMSNGKAAHIAISTLIDRCPTLSFKIENTETISRKNQMLRDDIDKADELLKEKTRIYEVFKDLELNKSEKIAVNKECKIEIIHKGRVLEDEEEI